MASSKLLDTHIHLWPSTALSATNHRWMTPGNSLAKRHGISDYNGTTSTTSPTQPSAFIYVETDRYLPDALPEIAKDEAGTSGAREKLEQWAHEPLEELKFLRRIVEGKPEEGDGFEVGDGDKMLGCVIWAPFQLPAPLFDLYLKIAEDVSGPQLWDRIVGFRYLLQGIMVESEMRKLVESEDWLSNILRLRTGRNGRGWSFDIGIDAHRGGIWQMEVAADMVEKVRKMEGECSGTRVRFVLDHICKPDLSSIGNQYRSRWHSNITRLAAQPSVYMKFSGAFNEFTPDSTPSTVSELLAKIHFEIDKIFAEYGPTGILFGSDWPVCNVGGPGKEQSWGIWREVVEKALMEKVGLGEQDREWVWWRTGCEAYGVKM